MGVPEDVMAFEILDTKLFEEEVYPQAKSGPLEHGMTLCYVITIII